jgi:DNA repair protein RadC
MKNYMREHLLEYGPQTLPTEELLALVLRTNAAQQQGIELVQRLLAKYGSLGGLVRTDCKELACEPGLGEASIALMKAMLELGRRLNKPQIEEKYQIRSPADAANLVMPDMADLTYEEMRVLVLNTRNRVVDNVPLYRGTINSSVLRAAEIFRLAIVRNCPAIIICHSHPSGDPTPSSEDLTVTQQLVEVGKLLDIELTDHLIIGSHRFVSLREELRW